jgi:CheY-like chemotaxis protein
MDSQPPRPRLDAQRTNERPHVLVVTDDPGLSEFFAEGLPLGGFWVSVIASGLQALEVFRLRQFDLILVDAEMQSFDAIEFLRRLRGVSSLDPGSQARTSAPAILVESFAQTEPRPVDKLGIAQTLVAPIELEDVVRSLHQVFAAWRQANPDAPLADSANLAF